MKRERVILVTGAARGLGRAIAVALAPAAGFVVVHYFRSLGEARETARLVRAAGAGALLVRADLGRDAGARALVRKAESAFGRLDVLVNNVGPILFKPWDELREEDWLSILKGTLLSASACTEAALPGMKARRWGRIVNIGYGRAEHLAAFPTILPYAVAKTGLLLLTRTAASSLRASGVTVNMVSPGLLEGGLLPPGRTFAKEELGTFADVAAAVRFLVSADARRITGTNLLVAGTWKM